MNLLAQLDAIQQAAHDAANSSDRFVLFLIIGIFGTVMSIAIVVLYKAFVKNQETHAAFVTTVYTEGVKGQAELKVVVQDCTECLVAVKSALDRLTPRS